MAWNAYNQPGVEAGKKAATGSLELQKGILSQLGKAAGPVSIPELASALRAEDKQFLIFYLCRHLAQTGRLKRIGHGPTSTFRIVNGG